MALFELFPRELWGIVEEYLFADISPHEDSILVTPRPCKYYTVYFYETETVMVPDCATQ